jgi:hypothetical protein
VTEWPTRVAQHTVPAVQLAPLEHFSATLSPPVEGHVASQLNEKLPPPLTMQQVSAGIAQLA